nr:DUF447 domain-containing protein [Methanocalculus alkaliphilus]
MNHPPLLREGINEVIGTTRFNAAPMGVISRGGRYTLALFKGSHTAENVVRDGWFVANIVHDPLLFVETTFGDLPEEAFVSEQVDGIPMHRLAAADAWAAFSARVIGESSEAYSIELMPIEERVLVDPIHRPVNRGFNAIIEAAVHTTRYLRNHDPELEWLIRHHLVLARKCGGEREREAAGVIEALILQESL